MMKFAAAFLLLALGQSAVAMPTATLDCNSKSYKFSLMIGGYTADLHESKIEMTVNGSIVSATVDQYFNDLQILNMRISLPNTSDDQARVVTIKAHHTITNPAYILAGNATEVIYLDDSGPTKKMNSEFIRCKFIP